MKEMPTKFYDGMSRVHSDILSHARAQEMIIGCC
jgi:hypothetical protein